MKSSLCSYITNANNWWQWLKNKSNDGHVTCNLIDYLDRLKEKSVAKLNADRQEHTAEEYARQLEIDVEEIKKNTKAYFSINFSCRTGDGGYKEITDENGNMLNNISRYIETIFTLMKCENIIMPKHYVVHKGTYCRTRWLPIFEPDFLNNYTICGHKIFHMPSYMDQETIQPPISVSLLIWSRGMLPGICILLFGVIRLGQ